MQSCLDCPQQKIVYHWPIPHDGQFLDTPGIYDARNDIQNNSSFYMRINPVTLQSFLFQPNNCMKKGFSQQDTNWL